MHRRAAATLSPALPTVAAPDSIRSDRWTIALIIVCFSVLSMAASLASEGFLEADGCTHYLYARFALAEPHYLVNIWGRPICTALYALPAQIADRFGVRCASLLLAIGVALVACAIARKQDHPRPALALLFTLAQPLLFMHSFSELTELPFALLLGLTFLAYQGRRWLFFALLASLLPLSRPEGFGFLVLAALALMLHRRFLWLIVLPIPLVVWSYAGWVLYGSPPEYPWYMWLSHNWPYAEKSAYQPGSILHFVLLLPAVTSPIIFPAMCLGIWRIFVESRLARFFHDQKTRCELLIALIPLMVLWGHSVLYATGRMASSGEVRYMLVVAPFWGVLGARGWTWFFRRIGSHDRRMPRLHRFEMKSAVLASLTLIAFNRCYQVLPLSYSDDWTHAREVAGWVQHTPLRAKYPRLMASHPAIFYFLNISQTQHGQSVEWTKENVDHPPPGTMMVWDAMYGQYNSDQKRVVPLDEILRAGWVPIHPPAVETRTRNGPSDWRIFLSPSGASAAQTTSPRSSRG